MRRTPGPSDLRASVNLIEPRSSRLHGPTPLTLKRDDGAVAPRLRTKGLRASVNLIEPRST